MSILRKLKTFFACKDKAMALADFFYYRQKRASLIRRVEVRKAVYGVKPKIVVSLTSFRSRFAQLPKTLKSLLFQSVKPDAIVVWFDEPSKEALTPELLELEKYGITYRFGVENLKPHKKYFYALQKFSDSIVITVDDDLIYPPDLIESLYRTWQKYPDCICGRRVHRIRFNENGTVKPYNDWLFECSSIKNPSHELFATGVGGVLYPPHIFDGRVFDAEKIKKLCLEADDVWLKWHELRLGVKVVWAKNNMIHPPIVQGSQKIALSSENVQGNKNDFFIQNCQKEIFDLNTVLKMLS